MTETEARAAVVAEARRWLGTPYHHRGRLRGIGVDCAMFPAAVYAARGLMDPDADFGVYPYQWNQNHNQERYLAIVERVAAEIEAEQVGPGDFVLWKFGRTFAHGAIVVDWPVIIHAYQATGVILDDADANHLFRFPDDSPRPRRLFSPWGSR